jgi:hypothetical protein
LLKIIFRMDRGVSPRWRALGALWLAYFALLNALRALYYGLAISPAWAEAGVQAPWAYLTGAAGLWAAIFGGLAVFWWRRGRPATGLALGAMVLYQAHIWAHRLLLMRSPFTAGSHGFALLITLLTLLLTSGLLGGIRRVPSGRDPGS